MGPIDATVVRVLTGDTITVDARVWFDITVRVIVRVEGFRAVSGLSSKKRAQRLLPPGTRVTITPSARLIDGTTSARLEYASEQPLPTEHGSFVAGMIASGEVAAIDSVQA